MSSVYQWLRIYVNPFVYQLILPSGFIRYTWDCALYIMRGSQVVISKIIVVISQKIDFVLANSADPDEMQHYAAFHLGLHCLPKYLFTGFWSSKG